MKNFIITWDMTQVWDWYSYYIELGPAIITVD
jgi:hypothetical protein